MKWPWFIQLLAPKEPPDPATVPREQWAEAARARARLGLKPWPSLPDDDYLNSVNGICTGCGIRIHGGQAISRGPEGTRCEDCFTKPVPPEGPADP